MEITNGFETSKYTPADLAFIGYLQDRMSESFAIPLELNHERVAKIIASAALWFYEWEENATTEEFAWIRNSEWTKYWTGMGAKLKLPNSIEAVFEMWDSRGSSTQISFSTRQFVTIPMLNAVGFSSFSGAGYGNQLMSNSDAIISLYEASTIKSTYTKGVRFKYTRMGNVLSVMGKPVGDIILSVACRIPIEDMYGDWYFQEYCLAACLKSAKMILSTFDWKLPGNVSINVDELSSQGSDRLKELEEEIKGRNNTDFVMSR